MRLSLKRKAIYEKPSQMMLENAGSTQMASARFDAQIHAGKPRPPALDFGQCSSIGVVP